MSRKLDWADKEARILAIALGIGSENETAKALLAVTLRLAYQRGGNDELNRANKFAESQADMDVRVFGPPRNKPVES